MPGFYIADRGFATNTVTAPADEKGKKKKMQGLSVLTCPSLRGLMSAPEQNISVQIKHIPVDHILLQSKI